MMSHCFDGSRWLTLPVELMQAGQEVYEAMLQVVASLPHSPALMIMAREQDALDRGLAGRHGVPLLFEAFADRAYTAC